MATKLWLVTAKRDNGKVKKGMNAEIMISGTNAKPNSRQIAEALNEKYSAGIPESAVNVHFFDIDEK